MYQHVERLCLSPFLRFREAEPQAERSQIEITRNIGKLHNMSHVQNKLLSREAYVSVHVIDVADGILHTHRLRLSFERPGFAVLLSYVRL